MNAIRLLGWLIFFPGTVGLWAQNPVLQLERRDPPAGAAWTGRTTLAFRVTVLHPAMQSGGSDSDFVLDPPGGWRGAISLLVTDAAGQPVDWSFVNMGQAIDRPLKLHRLGTASASFLLEPNAAGVVFPPGRYQVRARLATTAGKWQGRVDSPAAAVEIVGRAQPQLQVIGAEAGSGLRGWPLVVGVRITAPDGMDGGLVLPTEEKNWQTVLGLTLSDRAGAPVRLPLDRLPVADLLQANLKANASRTVWFRVPPEATGSFSEGPYRWTAKFSLAPARNRPDHHWSGSVSAVSAPVAFEPPPVPLPAEIARRHIRAQVEDAIIEARLLRARAEGGYMNDRMMAAQQAAGPLLRAERLALQWHDAHPDDPEGAVLVANVMAAQEDKLRAIAYTHRAIEADTRRRTISGGTPTEPSLALRLMARGFEAMPDELHTVLTPALRAGLQQARAGKLPLTPATPVPPAPAILPVVPVPAAPAQAAVMAPIIAPMPTSPPTPARPNPSGQPSPGKIVPAGELTEAKITADVAGQWAVSARAGSEYDRTGYSAARATGAPNVMVAGNSPDAWCPASKTNGTDWLEVSFANPVYVTEVRVRQNDAPGAMAKIEAIEPNGTVHIWWEGVDPYKAPATREIVWFAVRVPKTDYLVAKVKITLNLASGPGWKEIDAVQLVGAVE